MDIEGNLINARFLFVVAEFDLGFILLVAVFVVRREIRLRFDRFVDARKPRALFTGRIRVVFLVTRHRRRAHEQLIHAVVERFSRQFGIVFLHVLTQNGDRARHVGRSHARARKRFVSAGNGACDLAAVRRDLGFEIQARRRTPAREIRHKRSRGIPVMEGNGTDVVLRPVHEDFPRVHAHRAGGNGVVHFAERHADRTRNVIVNDTADRAVRHGVLHFFGKVDIAALDKGDRSSPLQRVLDRACIVGSTPHAADDDVFQRQFLRFIGNGFALRVRRRNAGGKIKLVEEIVLFAVRVVRFGEEHRVLLVLGNALFFICNEIVGGNAVDRSDRKRIRIGRRRTDRAAVGIGRKVGAVRAAEARAVIVARRNDQTDARFLDGLINVGDEITTRLHARFVRKARGRAEAHVDDVDAELHAVGDRRENIDAVRAADGFCFEIVGKHLANHELRVGRNAHKRIPLFVYLRVVVLARNNARHVRAVRRVGRIYVRIVVRIIVSIGNFIVVIYVGKRKRGRTLVRFEGGKLFAHAVLIQPERARRHRAERGVRVIQTGIEHGDDHPVALAGRVRRVVNARRIHVRIVGNGDGGNGVRFGNVNACNAFDLFDRGDVF